MIRKILIANRGEIAIRIIRACSDLGISPVAVYSEVDSAALHVRMADEAYCVGPSPSAESYLRIERILEVAKIAGVDAIHPGYGFLAENAAFARAVTEAGLIFVGPSAEAMDLMGSKTSARRVAQAAGVPIVPGTVEPLTSATEAVRVATEMGFPVMLKAAAGGGGKGMRLVATADELADALARARSEAMGAFGDDAVYIEKVVEAPRHIEIQVFADRHGHVVHLGERECSIQRRHQKVIEECPSPINSADLRAEMGAAAVRLTSAVNYEGAGTIEFLVSDTTRDFYFLEMNTRLQVEHPVTELVTGYDLVREQIRVADGEPLSFRQEDVQWHGHAIECRVYAEDPENNFLPSPGTISFLRVPAGPGIRDDGGVYGGAEVSIYYDPLISKLAAWGRDRTEAIDRLRRALDEYQVTGIKTTLPFFREIVRDAEFQAGRLDTGFIARFNERREQTEPNPQATNEDTVARDIAVIATALAQPGSGIPSSTADHPARSSKWRESGRMAALAGK
jgi:acetyl-CoA carboxylase biotin carboxylase subunit